MAVDNEAVEQMVRRERHSDGHTVRTFSYIAEPELAPDIVITPFRANSEDAKMVAGVRFEGAAIDISQAFHRGNGITFAEPELRAVARIFEEAANELLEDNDPKAAVELGAQGHGVC